MGSIVGVAIEVIMFGAIGVAGITMVETANTTGWSSTTKGLLFIVSLASIVAAILILLDKAGFKLKV